MAMEITRDQNDALLIATLGIKSVSVHFDDMTSITPTSADVRLSEDVYDGIEPTDDQQFAVRHWVAAKAGVDVYQVQIL